jgi:hypothetical protein
MRISVDDIHENLTHHLNTIYQNLEKHEPSKFSQKQIKDWLPEIKTEYSRKLLTFIIKHRDELAAFFNNNMFRRLEQYKDSNKVLRHQLLLNNQELSELREIIGFIDSLDDPTITPLVTDDESFNTEAVAISTISDIHFEERVDKKVVYGINEYNPDIAAKRINNYFIGLIKLIRKEREKVPINTLVLGLLGDMITGYIHEELMESNWLSPTEAIMGCRDCLVSGIKQLAEDSEVSRIIIPCCKGNHGRTSVKKKFSTGYKNSYEWMMYHDMSGIFKSWGAFDLLEWVIPPSELTYVEVFDKALRFGHGDHFKYVGGVGGIAIPLMKWLYRTNQVRHADMTFLGHWHQSLKPNYNCYLNGSVIGYNAYGASFGFYPETPMQLFTLLDKKRGFTVNTPILLT